MPANKFLTLNTGARIPALGLGTWKSRSGQVEHAVEFALKHGYRHIDTATAYGNEKAVGEGIKASGISRKDFFLTTKLANVDHLNVEQALERSLATLQTEYLDLWLMHWPAPMDRETRGPLKTVDWLDTWKTMEKVYKAHPDKVKAIGVCNLSLEYLQRLLSNCEIMPAAHQIELHPACPQLDIVDLCREKGIAVIAYSPLGSDNSPLLENEVVKKIANKRKVHPANVLISLQANRPDVAVVVKSVTESRIASNSKVIDLAEEEIKELDDIQKTVRFRACKPFFTGWGHLGFPDCK